MTSKPGENDARAEKQSKTDLFLWAFLHEGNSTSWFPSDEQVTTQTREQAPVLVTIQQYKEEGGGVRCKWQCRTQSQMGMGRDPSEGVGGGSRTLSPLLLIIHLLILEFYRARKDPWACDTQRCQRPRILQTRIENSVKDNRSSPGWTRRGEKQRLGRWSFPAFISEGVMFPKQETRFRDISVKKIIKINELHFCGPFVY